MGNRSSTGIDSISLAGMILRSVSINRATIFLSTRDISCALEILQALEVSND